MSTTINVLEITMILGRGTDKIFLHTDLPSATYPFKGSESLRLDITQGDGEKYCAKNFPGVPVREIRTGE